MSAYTRGPWIETGLFIESEDGVAIAVALPNIPNCERDANACLIATSPELLEALKELAIREPLCDDGDPLLTAARNAAKAAIAKAEGK